MARCSGVSDGGMSEAGIREAYLILPLEPPYTVGVQRLWTPWRREFIESASGSPVDACFLCALPAQGNDRPNLVVWRGERVFAILNRYPYNSGHLMVAPFVHTGDLTTLDEPVAAELMHATQHAVTILETEYRPHGFNIGMNQGSVAGAGIAPHLHQHVVPRWGGDTNFMPVVARTKVLPQLLRETRDLLAGAWSGV